MQTCCSIERDDKGMPEKISASLFDLVLSVSNVIDMMSTDVKEHHARVACASLAIAQEMCLAKEEVADLVLAALLHDIGIISSEEHSKVLKYDCANIDDHANKGWMLLQGFRPLRNVSDIVRYHHSWWSHCDRLTDVDEFSAVKTKLSLLSNILHLADHINILIEEPSTDVLGRVDAIVNVVAEESGRRFSSSVVEAFIRLSKRDSFWLDLVSPHISRKLVVSVSKQGIDLDGKDLHEFAKLMAKIIDFRCSFTATHSSSVAHVSAGLASLVGLPQDECDKIMLAGYLHDIGKLSVPREVLEKNASLSDAEYSKMRSHVYYTRRALEHITGFEDVVTWASQHHERLDGSGYPDGCREGEISLGSRIVAVADVFAALSESRPYRSKQTHHEVIACLMGLVETMVLDAGLVHLIVENFDELERQRLQGCDEIAIEYGKFSAASTMPMHIELPVVDNMNSAVS